MIDYHTHTPLCKHAEGTPEEFIAAALAAGLNEIGVSDHAPWPSGYDSAFRMTAEEFREYHGIVASMAKSTSDLKVRYSLEIDWVPREMDEVWASVADEPFDYLIGSVHYTDDLPFDNPDHQTVWMTAERSSEVWIRYYELLLGFTGGGGFEIIAHFDLPKKFGNRPPETDEIDRLTTEILTAAADNHIVMELNTAGLRKPVAEIYPSPDILRKAKKIGVPITFGSDAHSPVEVAANFAEAVALAKECGYDSYTTFETRVRKTERF
ncbi:MAG: histidinol-phosphatase HisJ family protein [Kiritimatiellaeota bacterium]|nr:histidinol-phosphatase HisJ family protein [Kiritimatiellota bacterium]